MEKTEMLMGRRGFLKGAAIASAAAAVGLAGCSAAAPSNAGGNEQDAAADIKPDETKECDICVVGAGISGLAACVEAAQQGAKVIVLEAAGSAGGNGLGVEGSFAHGSPLQEEQGIEFDFTTLIEKELRATQYRVDGNLWRDLYDKSGDNIRWLMDNGVKFSGEVNDYGTGGGIVSMHWYEGGKGSVGYVPPMVAKAEELGVEFVYNAKAEHPVMDGQRVAGVLAQRDGSWLQVNARAVVLASGGFGANSQMVARIGYDEETLWYYGSPMNDGGGWRIATEAGAEDFSMMAADNAHAYIRAMPHNGPTDMPNCGTSMCPYLIWVNRDGKRFVNEDCAVENFCQQNPPRWNQKEWYFVWDMNTYDACCQMYGVDVEKGHEILAASAASNDEDTLFGANTIEELAEHYGLPAETLAAEVKAYNEHCANKADKDWCKGEQWLMPLEQGPFYIARPDTLFLMTIGAIATNRDSQAINADKEPIEGLYAVGVDGCMLYRNVYTIDAPGSCSGNGINMGRTAARHACAAL